MSFEIPDIQFDKYEPKTPPDSRLEEAFLGIDVELTDEITAYLRYLPKASLSEFRDMDFSKKIDKMCWVYGQSEHTRNKSVHLKALKILKGMGDFMFHGEHDQPRRYDVAFDANGYWSAVDTEIQAYLHKLAESNEGTELTWPRDENPNELGQTHLEYSWRTLGFAIDKRVSYQGDEPFHAIYDLSRLPKTA